LNPEPFRKYDLEDGETQRRCQHEIHTGLCAPSSLSGEARLYLKPFFREPTPVRSLRESHAFIGKFRDFTRGLSNPLRYYHWGRLLTVFLANPFGSGVVAEALRSFPNHYKGSCSIHHQKLGWIKLADYIPLRNISERVEYCTVFPSWSFHNHDSSRLLAARWVVYRPRYG